MSNRKFTLIVLIAGLVCVAFLTCRVFLIRTARVPGGAMSNTIVPGDHVLMWKSFGEIERGQVVVFQWPNDSNHYIKRVVGLPGETIQHRGRTIYINGRALNEQRVLVEPENFEGQPLQIRSKEGSGPYSVFYQEKAYDYPDTALVGTNEPFHLPAGHYFLLGDNRDNSEDSRYRGPVPRSLIWGTAVLIYYSEHNDRILKRIH
jgi:signal peptidase I